MSYRWKFFGDESKPKIAILATSNGLPYKDAQKAIENRVTALQNLGFCVVLPEYDDGSLIFDPTSNKSSSEIGSSHERAVEAKTGAKQIIECAENGWDIFPYMGGWGMVDKIGEVVEYFQNPSSAKPAKPIRLFGYSDCSFGCFLQSHHPDIFRFYSTDLLSRLSSPEIKAEIAGAQEYEPYYQRKVTALKELLRDDAVKSYPRKILSPSSLPLVDEKMISYYPLHTDNIYADAVNFDEKLSEFAYGHMAVRAQKLETSKPYILGLEGFLQRPTFNKKYDTKFPEYLDQFLQQRQSLCQLPLAIEIGLFASRVDGNNGYISKLHDPETGLIAINELNVERLYANREKLTKQIREVVVADPKEAEKLGITITEIPQSVKDKVTSRQDLEREDIITILECENKKILQIREKILKVCQKYDIPAIENNRHGHVLNMGVIGGGLVNMRVVGQEVVLDQVPTKTKFAEYEQQKFTHKKVMDELDQELAIGKHGTKGRSLSSASATRAATQNEVGRSGT
jgi:hypothetical protein